MRTIDVFFAFPSVLLAIALSGALGAGITNGLISLTVVFIPPIARVAESVTTSVRTRDYVEAARASGAGAFTIVRVHVLGNVLGPIFVYAMSLIAVSMILASGLSFLGLGVKPPEPEWGLMLNTLRTAIYTQPLLCALPGRDDLHHLDLVQPADRRPALGHGHQGLTRWQPPRHRRPLPTARRPAAARGGRPGQALPAQAGSVRRAPAPSCARSTASPSRSRPARRSASSASPAAASRPRPGCSCT